MLHSTSGTILHKLNTVLSASITITGLYVLVEGRLAHICLCPLLAVKGNPPRVTSVISCPLSCQMLQFCMILFVGQLFKYSMSAFMSQHVSSKYRKSRQTLDRLIYSASNPSYGYNPFMKSDVLTGRQLRLLILLVNPIHLGPHVTSLS